VDEPLQPGGPRSIEAEHPQAQRAQQPQRRDQPHARPGQQRVERQPWHGLSAQRERVRPKRQREPVEPQSPTSAKSFCLVVNPTCWAARSPFLKTMMVGTPRTPYLPAVMGDSSTSSSPTLTLPPSSSAT